VIFRYPGGKSKKSIREKIIKRFPKNFHEYREPMVGGGGLFFHISSDKKRWINDIDENLISVYKSLRDDHENFILRCKEIKSDLKKVFEEMVENEKYQKDIKFFFINRTVWGGRVNYSIKSRLYFSNPKGWNIMKTNKLEKAANILQNVKISNVDYSQLLAEDGDDVLIYIDPPYYLNTKLDKNSRLYRHNFEMEDHKKLCEEIKKCKHKIILSYDDNLFIRKLYKGFNFGRGLGITHSRAENWKYCGTSSAKTQNKTKRTGKELIISNF
jgi:DNA adenine methylase